MILVLILATACQVAPSVIDVSSDTFLSSLRSADVRYSAMGLVLGERLDPAVLRGESESPVLGDASLYHVFPDDSPGLEFLADEEGLLLEITVFPRPDDLRSFLPWFAENTHNLFLSGDPSRWRRALGVEPEVERDVRRASSRVLVEFPDQGLSVCWTEYPDGSLVTPQFISLYRTHDITGDQILAGRERRRKDCFR